MWRRIAIATLLAAADVSAGDAVPASCASAASCLSALVRTQDAQVSAALGAYQKTNHLKVDCWPTAAVLDDMQRKAARN